MQLLALVLAWLATARLAILLTRDAFPPSEWIRTRVLQYATGKAARTRSGVLLGHPDEHPLYVLVSCPWCCSFWIGLPVVAVAWFWPTAWWFVIPAAALTASLVAGAVAKFTA